MRVGIIDVGTNSIHLLIGEVGRSGSFRVILKARDLTRLGDEGLVEGSLTPAATRRATSILQRYAAILKRRRVDHVEAASKRWRRARSARRRTAAHSCAGSARGWACRCASSAAGRKRG
ncbi:MAG: hypothetical protein HYY59_05330 [Candidatus Omnitrophica bacterium]|nr:hypothetical protein [Candidatus Omnitrophota bacterium]